jgi:hypothetical protein
MTEAEIQERMKHELRTLLADLENDLPPSNRRFAMTVRRHAYDRITEEEMPGSRRPSEI